MASTTSLGSFVGRQNCAEQSLAVADTLVKVLWYPIVRSVALPEGRAPATPQELLMEVAAIHATTSNSDSSLSKASFDLQPGAFTFLKHHGLHLFVIKSLWVKVNLQHLFVSSQVVSSVEAHFLYKATKTALHLSCGKHDPRHVCRRGQSSLSLPLWCNSCAMASMRLSPASTPRSIWQRFRLAPGTLQLPPRQPSRTCAAARSGPRCLQPARRPCKLYQQPCASWQRCQKPCALYSRHPGPHARPPFGC